MICTGGERTTGEHPSILRHLCKQDPQELADAKRKLINRAQKRSRFLGFFHGLNLDVQLSQLRVEPTSIRIWRAAHRRGAGVDHAGNGGG